jgi:hypothetical protein
LSACLGLVFVTLALPGRALAQGEEDIIFVDGFECVDDQGCGAPVCGDTSACGFDSACDETGTKTQRCTPQVCSSGSCGQGTEYTQTAACLRVTDGNPCGLTSFGCPPGTLRELCCSTAPVSTCSMECSDCQ